MTASAKPIKNEKDNSVYLEAERFKTSPDVTDEATVLTTQELNWLFDGFDLWRSRPHQVLSPVSWPDPTNHQYLQHMKHYCPQQDQEHT